MIDLRSQHDKTYSQGTDNACGPFAVCAALGLDKPWHKSPGDLWDWAVQQPGARVVPDDEFGIPWSA